MDERGRRPKIGLGRLARDEMDKATLGAGCFWGVEAAFRQIDGVISTAVGYSGGHTPHPTYLGGGSGATRPPPGVFVGMSPAHNTHYNVPHMFLGRHQPPTTNHH